MASVAYRFRPLSVADLPLIARWLHARHWRRWWGVPEAGLAEIEEAMLAPSTQPFVIVMDGRPIGYIQSYDIHAERDHPYSDRPPGSLGIDLSIGEPDLVGKGHGPRIVDAFVRDLFAGGAPRIVIDPDPENVQAIRAYAKAGFRPIDRRLTQYGPTLLMARDALEPTTAE